MCKTTIFFSCFLKWLIIKLELLKLGRLNVGFGRSNKMDVREKVKHYRFKLGSDLKYKGKKCRCLTYVKVSASGILLVFHLHSCGRIDLHYQSFPHIFLCSWLTLTFPRYFAFGALIYNRVCVQRLYMCVCVFVIGGYQ
jgi:hypothetical protein